MGSGRLCCVPGGLPEPKVRECFERSASISGAGSRRAKRGSRHTRADAMCINCLKRALNDIMTTEHVIAQTGGSKVVALQAVAHPCCSNPRCRKEGHCHLRVRRADLSVGEWV